MTDFEEFQDASGPTTLEEFFLLRDAMEGTDLSTAPFEVQPFDGGQPGLRVSRVGHPKPLLLKSQAAIDYYRDWLDQRWLAKDETVDEGRQRLWASNRRDRDA